MGTIFQKSGLLKRYKCSRVECEEYIGEFGRTFGERFTSEDPSPTHDHYNTTGHTKCRKFLYSVEEQNLAILI